LHCGIHYLLFAIRPLSFSRQQPPGLQRAPEEEAMKVARILCVTVTTLGLAGFSGVASADAAAGKTKFEAQCAECHEVADFEGETAAALTESLKKIVAGETKHKSALKLTDAEIADLAAFMAAGK